MKVLQVSKLYPPWIGGIETTVQGLAEGLRDKVHMQVLVCQSTGRAGIDLVNGVKVWRAASLGMYRSMPVSPSFPLLLKRLSRDVDILHFHSPFPLGELSCFFVQPSQPIVVTWHSDIVRQRIILKAHRFFLRRFLNRASRILATSQAAIEASEFLGEFRTKCDVVPLGIDLRRFEMDDGVGRRAQEIRRRFGQPLILFVGRLVYYKGVEYLIDAMRDVDGHLVIVGSGSLRGRLVERSTRLGMANRVHFVGSLSDEDLVPYFHACDLLVLPSIHNSEAFGLVQLEAMACGKPVVNTALPTGVPFVSQDGVTGLTVPPRDSAALGKAINTLTQDRDLRERLGQQAWQRVESEYSLEIMAEKVLRVYEAVTKG